MTLGNQLTRAVVFALWLDTIKKPFWVVQSTRLDLG